MIKEYLKARNLSVQGNKPDLLLRMHQAIEANLLIVIGLYPNILDSMTGNGFALMAYWELRTRFYPIWVISNEAAFYLKSLKK